MTTPAPPPTPSGALTEEVITLVRAHAVPLDPECVSLEEACGRVLRQPVLAPEDQPAFDRSAMDGYAVGLNDVTPTYRVVDQLRAGDWKPRLVALGEAVQVATGAALPEGNLRVLPKEDVLVKDGVLRILRPSSSRYVRLRGEAARQGQELLHSGSVLTPGALSLLASLGHTRPLVSPLPRVTHWVTGNELVPPDQVPGPGQIRDSNSHLVSAFLRAWRVSATRRHLPEEAGAVQNVIQRPPSEFQSTHVLLVSGGASVGEHDFTRRLLEGLGFTILIANTHLRPGKPLLFGVRGATLAFGLPGNPLAHFVCLNLFVRVALEGLIAAPSTAFFQPGTLAVGWEGEPSPRETLWPAKASRKASALEVTPLPWTSSGDLTPLATANALLQLPPNSPPLPKGATVSCLVIHP